MGDNREIRGRQEGGKIETRGRLQGDESVRGRQDTDKMETKYDEREMRGK